MNKLTLLIVFLFSLNSFAQKTAFEDSPQNFERCGIMELYDQKFIENPALIEERDLFEYRVEKWLSNNDNLTKNREDAQLVIPVVVHVIWNTSSQNVSMTRIEQQIERLSLDFRKMNEDTTDIPAEFQDVSADSHIDFALAQVDPDGAPTDGVTRTYTTQSVYNYPTSNQWIKHTDDGGHDAWDSERYLNLWVCNISNGILGYAQFPWDTDETEDGVVILYSAFGITSGSYDMGRTATHEVGHWLGLYHIWGDGGCGATDYVDDTPDASGSNFGCPSHPHNTCGTNDMFMNYMDYVDDDCMVMYTEGQSDRMWASIASYRAEMGQDSLHLPLPALPAASSLSYSLDYNNVTLNWNYDADTSSYADSLIGFNIYRNFEKIYTISDTSIRTYEDQNIPDGDYVYYVKSLFQLINQAESDSSNNVFVPVRTIFPPENLSYTTEDYSIVLNWTGPPTKGALAGFEVYRNDELVAEIDDAEQFSYADGNLLDNEYEYFLRSVDEFDAVSDTSLHLIANLQTLVDTFITDKRGVAGGGSVQFNYETSGPVDTYAWNFYDGIADFTDIANPIVRYDTAGDYNVKLTVRNEMNTVTIYKSDYITCWWTVSSEEIDNKNYTIYPNPANDVLNIKLSNDFDGYTSIELFDLSGKMIKQENFGKTKELALDVSILSAGVYTVLIKTGNQTQTAKITIQ